MIRQEEQKTVTEGDFISGELTIKFTDIRVEDFLRYRKAVRDLTGFSRFAISHTVINEQAIINQCNLERRPDEFRDAPPPPIPQSSPVFPSAPAQKLPGKPEPAKVKQKEPHMTQASRIFLCGCTGLANIEIITKYRARFKNTRFSDTDILKMFARAQGIT